MFLPTGRLPPRRRAKPPHGGLFLATLDKHTTIEHHKNGKTLYKTLKHFTWIDCGKVYPYASKRQNKRNMCKQTADIMRRALAA
jgi:hypothetical protein